MYKRVIRTLVIASSLLVNLQGASADGTFGFVEGTKVLVQAPDGNSYLESAIENIRINDVLVSCAEGVCTSGKVTRMFREDGSSAILVTFRDQKEMTLGTDQAVMVECGEDSYGWVTASDLKPGDTVIGPSGKKAEVASVHSDLEADLYTFEVSPHHTYCAADFWVHNPEHSTTLKAEVCANVKVVKGCVSVSHTIKYDKAEKRQEKPKPIQVNPPKKVQTLGKL